MPCDIGYRSVADAEIATIESRVSAPAIDQELLDRLGVDDPPFLAWLDTLDRDPLLDRALERTRDAIGDTKLRIDGGALVIESTVPSVVATVTQRWQIEVLRIVCELLDFQVEITARGGGLFLEGEKHGASGVHEYISIAIGDGTEIRFEHFASDEALAVEQARFLALARKLGMKLRLHRERRAGQPIKPGTIHPHKGKGKA